MKKIFVEIKGKKIAYIPLKDHNKIVDELKIKMKRDSEFAEYIRLLVKQRVF